jgi:hypothetical protein
LAINLVSLSPSYLWFLCPLAVGDKRVYSGLIVLIIFHFRERLGRAKNEWKRAKKEIVNNCIQIKWEDLKNVR